MHMLCHGLLRTFAHPQYFSSHCIPSHSPSPTPSPRLPPSAVPRSQPGFLFIASLCLFHSACGPFIPSLVLFVPVSPCLPPSLPLSPPPSPSPSYSVPLSHNIQSAQRSRFTPPCTLSLDSPLAGPGPAGSTFARRRPPWQSGSPLDPACQAHAPPVAHRRAQGVPTRVVQAVWGRRDVCAGTNMLEDTATAASVSSIIAPLPNIGKH
ncbi:hypothetical protein BC628DRAFT_925486 [Trametes gibbosa]|nr:hypothetical protein BC628DRAFT_925486 [Trametes gibbosa]